MMCSRLIEMSSGEGSQIIQTNDGISFQTNLLAPNEGAEAARDIKTWITISAAHVADGADLVTKAGRARNRWRWRT